MTHTATARTRRPNMAAARRALIAADVHRVIVEAGLVVADAAVGADAQAANLNAALAALDAAGIGTARDDDYPTWMAALV